MNVGTLTGQITIEDRVSSTLTIIGRNVETFAKKLDGDLKVIGVSGTIAAAAITAISTAIITLGNRGSDVNDVAETFKKFSGSIYSANASMEAMRKGTLGTVTDFDLMKSASRLLAANVKLTADQFGTLSSAAFVLQNQGLGSTKEMMDMLSQAMLTGRTRTLAMKIGVIDTTTAMKDYAASHDTTVKGLTQVQKIEATRIAILDALNRKVREAGVVQRDFGESMEAAIVSIKNWGDRLASAVASSPNVMRAVNTIGDSISKSFGTTGEDSIKALVGWINKFADAVTAMAPRVISAAATVKNWIADTFDTIQKKIKAVWDWLVDFNDRWNITTNLVAGAKAAWGMLQMAFDLVGKAIDMVVRAWQQMPEWLQRIARTALEAAGAATVYAGAISLAAAPVRALIPIIDTTINIIGNLTGAVYSTVSLWGHWPGVITGVRTAFIGLNAAITSNTVVISLNAIASKSMAAGQAFLLTSFVNIINACGSLNRALGVTAVVEGIVTTATGVLNAAKLWLIQTLLALHLNYTALIIRLNLATASMVASTIATKALAVAQTALGVALLAVKYVLLPLVAVWAGWKLGPMSADWLGLSEHIEYASLKLQRWMGLIDQNARDQDLWNSVQENTKRRAREAGKDVDGEADAFKRLSDEISGKTLVEDVDRLNRVLESLGKNPTHAQLRRVADAAEALRQRGAELPPVLEGIRSWFHDLDGEKPAFEIDKVTAALKRMQTQGAIPMADPFSALRGGIPSGTYNLKLPQMFPSFGPQVPQEVPEPKGLGGGESFADKVKKLFEALTKGDDAIRVTEAAFAKLTDAQKLNADVQDRLLPKIQEVANAHRGQLSPAMLDTYNQILAYREAMLEQETGYLAWKGITVDFIRIEKEAGLTEEQIATQLGVSVAALQRYETQINKTAAAEKARQAFKNEEMAKAAEYQNIGYQAMFAAEESYNNKVKELSMSSLEYQRALIDQRVQKEIDSFVGPFDAKQRFEKATRAEAELTKQALIVDMDAVRNNSLQAYEDMANKAWNTYKAMIAAGADQASEGVKNAKRMAEGYTRAFEEAQGKLSKLGPDWELLKRESKGHLEQLRDQAWDNWKEMAKQPKVYSDAVRLAFLQTAQDASAAVDKTHNAWKEMSLDFFETLKGAFEGGGGLIGAIESLAVQLAKSFTNAMLYSIRHDFEAKLAAQIAQSTAAAAQAGVQAGIGTMLGPLTMPGQRDALGGIGTVLGPLTMPNQPQAGGSVGLSGSTLGWGLLGGALGGVGIGMSGGSFGSQMGSMAMSGLSTGISASMMGLGLGASVALGAATFGIGAAVIGIMALIKKAGEARKAVVSVADAFGGFDTLHKQLNTLGDEGERLWIKLTQQSGSKKAAEATGNEIKAALEALQNDVQNYGMTIMDLADKQKTLTTVGDSLLASFNRLKGAGYDQDAILRQMSGDMNAYIVASVKAGTKIPQAMQPILNKLIETGKLTNEAARALMGLAEEGMPSLQEITDAASRYGLTLDQLGPKVRQLSITTSAEQIAKDFNLLTLAGADFTAIMGGAGAAISTAEQEVMKLKAEGADTAAVGTEAWDLYRHAVEKWQAEVGNGNDKVANMRQQIQGLVTQAIQMGMELPASLKPIVEKMIEAGLLTDDLGEKLTDTTRLTFAEDLSKMFDTLMEKLDALIDKITVGVGGALTEVGGMTVQPKIQPSYVQSQSTDSGFQPEGMSAGGVVYAARGRVIPFTPRGTDTVPAMLTPGETVLPVGGAREELVGEIVVPLELDGEQLAQAIVRVRRRIRH